MPGAHQPEGYRRMKPLLAGPVASDLCTGWSG
jgi:hypothetical protein